MQQFDENMLRAILSLSDEQLWQTIKAIAAQSGITLPAGTPPKSELARLRSVIGSTTPNLDEAMRIVEQYKKDNGV